MTRASSLLLRAGFLAVAAVSLLACAAPTGEDAEVSEEALGGACTIGEACSASIRLVEPLAPTPSASLRRWARADVTGVTEAVLAYREETTPLLILPAGKEVFLSGAAGAKAPWAIDDVLLVEVLREDGSVQAMAQLGGTLRVKLRSWSVQKVGRETFDFNAGEIELSWLMPKNVPFRVRVTVLDWAATTPGNIARASDVFLHTPGVPGAAPPPPPPPPPPACFGLYHYYSWSCDSSTRAFGMGNDQLGTCRMPIRLDGTFTSRAACEAKRSSTSCSSTGGCTWERCAACGQAPAYD
jgi:hypothetical protein